MPEYSQLLPKKQLRALAEWCKLVSVLRFNCGRYDLIKEYFAELLTDATGKVQVGKKGEHDEVYKNKRVSLR